MFTLALVLYLVFVLLAFGVRTVVQVRATGSSGFHGLSGSVGSIEWLAGAGFVVALAFGLAGPLFAVTGAVSPIAALERTGFQIAGVVLACGGIAGTLWAQVAMGSSWRIGVDPSERTALVTTGVFAVVRNPVFAAMFPFALGLALMVPSVVSIVGFVVLVVSLELQVRIVEEPYLLKVHGEAYRRYGRSVGRFVPGVGKLR